MGERAVVVGATGFLGSHLVRALVEQRREVLAVCRNPNGARTVLPTPVTFAQATLPHAPWERIFSPGDTVFLLAATRNAPGHNLHDYVAVNVDGVEQLVQAARRAGVRRVVQVSTALALDDTAGAWSVYVRTRREGLDRVEAVARDGLDVVSVLPALVYGPDHALHRNRITNQVRALLRNRVAWTLGRGDAKRSLVYVRDVVQALLLAEGVVGCTRLVVAGEELSHAEFNRRVLALAGQVARVQIPLPRRGAMLAARLVDGALGNHPGAGYVAALRTLSASWRFQTTTGLGLPTTPFDTGARETLAFLGRE
ncbi:MAG: NAD(P)-dependent oxidoreductase [Myxococcota bacterium]